MELSLGILHRRQELGLEGSRNALGQEGLLGPSHSKGRNSHDSQWKFHGFPHCAKLPGFIFPLEEQLFHGFASPGHSNPTAKSLGRVKFQPGRTGSSLISNGNNSQAVLQDPHPRKKSAFSFFQPQLCSVLFPFPPQRLFPSSAVP